MESLRRLLLAFVSFVGAGELALRIAGPTPRVQAIRAAEVTSFELVDGVPFWAAEDPEVPHRCNSDARPRAVFVGSSIFRGSGLGSGAEVFSSQLSELAPGWCVDNVAEPAFTGPQKAIAAMRAPDGTTLVYLLSDDNYRRMLQRTLLLCFALQG